MTWPAHAERYGVYVSMKGGRRVPLRGELPLENIEQKFRDRLAFQFPTATLFLILFFCEDRMDWWRTFWAPLIVAVLAALTAGIVLGRLQRPEVPAVSASVQWVDFPSPLFSLDVKAFESVNKLVQGVSGGADVRSVLEKLQYSSKMSVATISVSNNGNIRSKEIELSAADVTFFPSETSKENKPTVGAMTIKALNPGATADVFALTPSATYRHASLLALHDGAKIGVISKVLPDEVVWLVNLLLDSFLLTALLFIFLIFGIVVAVMVPFVATIESSPALKAKHISKKDMAKLVAFVDYVRQHHPDKLP